MIFNKENPKIIHLGNIIFWHEEILDFISQECGVSASKEEGYTSIGFKPDFYSFHLAEIDKIRHKIFAFTILHPLENSEKIHTAIMFLNKSSSSESQIIIGKTIVDYINECIAKVLNSQEEVFGQTLLGIRLLDIRREFINSIIQE
ncbi:hypothetical protein [Okeania sp. SIO2B3]|uniref:hypothetical protein n=1 Tax=Okeania sp. SIO2B3 TaxID=2607784 RepID=UPI0013BFE9E7|nr:hypothetical protein [Okeania sp. SIO2B3]NET44871.1 hypothetical protein [Okeania sp. SIO2B3]